MVNKGIEDPDGWTLKNNKHPNENVNDPTNPDDWRNYFEWDKESYAPIVCHSCLLRAPIGSGNCINGGEYWLCVRNGTREKNKKKLNAKKDVQTTLM